ncbi:MAG TPA: GTPase HflX, partial [Phycisphaerales bacterium]|nr:GTPase HflX [Phycisphaerales bacterium]
LLLNKVDQLRDNSRVLVWQQRVPGAIPIVAPKVSHPGHKALRELVLEEAQGGVHDLRITVPLADAKTISVLENRGQVSDRDYTDEAVTLHVRIGNRQLDQLRSLGARMSVAKAEPAPKKASKTAAKRRPARKAAKR